VGKAFRLSAAGKLVIAERWEHVQLFLSPWRGFAEIDLVVIHGAAVPRDVAGHEHAVDRFLGDRSNQRLTRAGSGGVAFAGVGKSLIAVSNQSDVS
jgi:hypothetical protein